MQGNNKNLSFAPVYNPKVQSEKKAARTHCIQLPAFPRERERAIKSESQELSLSSFCSWSSCSYSNTRSTTFIHHLSHSVLHAYIIQLPPLHKRLNRVSEKKKWNNEEEKGKHERFFFFNYYLIQERSIKISMKECAYILYSKLLSSLSFGQHGGHFRFCNSRSRAVLHPPVSLITFRKCVSSFYLVSN